MTVTNFSCLSPEEQLEQAKKSEKWFAPSLFITYYGHWGFKFEADCYRYENGKLVQTDGYNIDGANRMKMPDGTIRQLSRNEMYRSAKERFWEAWNKDHKGEHLLILKSMSSYGL